MDGWATRFVCNRWCRGAGWNAGNGLLEPLLESLGSWRKHEWNVANSRLNVAIYLSKTEVPKTLGENTRGMSLIQD